ncbi:MAG: pilus assembly protein [Pseudobutyrivibrio sp.]|nr:pilus assembly protein [Pseudobutyrivibrio sp.]
MSLLSKLNNTYFCPIAQGKKISTINKAKTHKENILEMPIYASFLRGSYTIEAAIVLPIFITLMIFGMFLFRVLQVEAGVQKSINHASRMMAVTLGNVANEGESDVDMEPNSQDPTINGELSEAALLASTIAYCGVEIGKNKVPLSFVDGGAIGFNFLNSSVEGSYIDVQVDYSLTFPIGLLGDYTYDVSQRARCRKWVGYENANNKSDCRYVYITEHGEVYHSNYYCTYLNPSVHRILVNQVSSARNKGGATYKKCHRCGWSKAKGYAYITDYGTAYHSDINCTEIKHNIQKVPYEEVKDSKRPCSKCGVVYSD